MTIAPSRFFKQQKYQSFEQRQIQHLTNPAYAGNTRITGIIREADKAESTIYRSGTNYWYYRRGRYTVIGDLSEWQELLVLSERQIYRNRRSIGVSGITGIIREADKPESTIYRSGRNNWYYQRGR